MRLLISLLLVLIGAQAGIAQVLNATVKVDIPLLKPEEKLALQNLGSRVADFINGREWIKDPDPDIKIDISITIIIQSEYRGNEGYIYVSQVLFSSSSKENFYDKSWEFPYLPNDFWNYQNNTFHPIISLLDYYIGMIMGGELDTYSELGGNGAYNYALGICQLGKSSIYSRGWQRREDLVLEYTREFAKPLRLAKLVYYDALDAAKRGELKNQLEYAEEMLQLLEQSTRYQGNSLPMQRYMEGHSRRIAIFFQIAPNRQEYYNRLMNIDARFKEDYQKILGVN